MLFLSNRRRLAVPLPVQARKAMECDQFAGLIAYSAEHEQELRSLKCASLGLLLKTGEARAGRSGVPDRTAFSRILKKRGHALSCQQQEQLKAWELRLCLSSLKVTLKKRGFLFLPLVTRHRVPAST